MVWEAVSSNGKAIAKFNHWPDPFKSMVQQLDVLACEDTWQAQIKMYGSQLGEWFFAAFIPSPREIERKTFTGSYRCGFFFTPGWDNPIDIVWKNENIGKMLGEIARPFVTALFYIWAAETALDALSRWQSVMYAMEKCDLNRGETLLRDAHSPMTVGHHEGGAAFAEVIWDPMNWAITDDCAVNVLFPWECTGHAYGYIDAESHHVRNIRIQMTNGEDVLEEAALGDLGPGGVLAWDIGGNMTGPGTMQPRIICDVEDIGVVPANFRVVRFTTSQGAGDHHSNTSPLPTPNIPCTFSETGIPLPTLGT